MPLLCISFIHTGIQIYGLSDARVIVNVQEFWSVSFLLSTLSYSSEPPRVWGSIGLPSEPQQELSRCLGDKLTYDNLCMTQRVCLFCSATIFAMECKKKTHRMCSKDPTQHFLQNVIQDSKRGTVPGPRGWYRSGVSTFRWMAFRDTRDREGGTGPNRTEQTTETIAQHLQGYLILFFNY